MYIIWFARDDESTFEVWVSIQALILKEENDRFRSLTKKDAREDKAALN